ncbi:MAG TPA: hypothetical protein VFI11_13130 [Anaerolineales bacterium]|nr:hypothetical protein [Anaerolineales bacterium]
MLELILVILLVLVLVGALPVRRFRYPGGVLGLLLLILLLAALLDLI